MHRTTIHTRLFRLIYDSPKQSNVLRRIKIRVNNINFAFVIGTLKNLVSTLTDMEAGRTGLGSVSRFYNNQFNTIQSSLVSQKGAQLSERPTTKFSPKLFVSAFRSKADIGQILNGYTFTLSFSRLYNAFCDSVVDYGSRCSFFARKAFQEASSPFRPFALNRTTNRLPMFTVCVKPIGRMFNAIRSNNYVRETEVNTDKGLNIVHILFGNINSLKEIKFTFFVDQIRFPLNVRQISRIVANKINLLSTSNAPQGNDVIRFVSHNTIIISNTSKWSEGTFDFLIKFIRICNLCNRAYKHLGRKFKSGLIDVVNFVMEFEIVKDAFRPSYFRNSIANGICFLDSFKKQISLFSGWKKFDFQRQFHNTNEAKSSDIRKYITIIINKRRNLGQFLPLPKGEGVSLLPTL